jgi:hypothetical protein
MPHDNKDLRVQLLVNAAYSSILQDIENAQKLNFDLSSLRDIPFEEWKDKLFLYALNKDRNLPIAKDKECVLNAYRI